MPSSRKRARSRAEVLADMAVVLEGLKARGAPVPPAVADVVRARHGAPWGPLPGPQTEAYNSHADITGYGGSAGGGKSDLLLGLATTKHTNSVIFRREQTQLRAMITRSRQILRDTPAKFNQQTKTWRDIPGDRTIELGGVAHSGSEEAWQGQPHDLIGIDELTHFYESQFWFLTGWNRTTVPGQRCRVVLTFNPPTTAEGQWVMRLFAPWLDRDHPNKAVPGEIRHIVRVGDELRECPDATPVRDERAGLDITPRSITFINASLKDNPILAKTGYASTVAAMPEPLRSQLLYGDFYAGLTDDAWQVIPTAWIENSIRLWKQYQSAPYLLSCIGLDVAHGGRDRTVIAPRHERWVARLLCYPGRDTPTGMAAASFTMKVARPGVPINVDAIGFGASAAERLYEQPPIGYGADAFPINFGESSDYCDRSGKLKCRNVRAEAYWRLRDALDPEFNDVPLMLPDDEELRQELTQLRWRPTPGGILLEEKDQVQRRIGRSPDKADAVALSMLPSGVPSLGIVGGQSGRIQNHHVA